MVYELCSESSASKSVPLAVDIGPQQIFIYLEEAALKFQIKPNPPTLPCVFHILPACMDLTHKHRDVGVYLLVQWWTTSVCKIADFSDCPEW